MKSYFTQFGDVTRVRLSRNKKVRLPPYPSLEKGSDNPPSLQTGKSKHYGFIEFDSASVAKIVAETMDNYLLNGHIMQCKVIPKDKVHPQLWVGANRKWRTVPPEQLTRAKHNKVRLLSMV
jgi:nucleolar protein 15